MDHENCKFCSLDKNGVKWLALKECHYIKNSPLPGRLQTIFDTSVAGFLIKDKNLPPGNPTTEKIFWDKILDEEINYCKKNGFTVKDLPLKNGYLDSFENGKICYIVKKKIYLRRRVHVNSGSKIRLIAHSPNFKMYSSRSSKDEGIDILEDSSLRVVGLTFTSFRTDDNLLFVVYGHLHGYLLLLPSPVQNLPKGHHMQLNRSWSIFSLQCFHNILSRSVC